MFVYPFSYYCVSRYMYLFKQIENRDVSVEVLFYFNELGLFIFKLARRAFLTIRSFHAQKFDIIVIIKS